MRLRDYQEAAADGVFREWHEHASALAVLPTGLGKTVLFAEIIRRMHERGARAMVLAHREELITQAADKIHRVTGLEAQIEMGEYHVQPYFGQMPPVVVSTVQTHCAGGDGAGRAEGVEVIDTEDSITTKELEKLVRNKSVLKKLTPKQRQFLLAILKSGKVVIA